MIWKRYHHLVDVVSIFRGCINFLCWLTFPPNFLNLDILVTPKRLGAHTSDKSWLSRCDFDEQHLFKVIPSHKRPPVFFIIACCWNEMQRCGLSHCVHPGKAHNFICILIGLLRSALDPRSHNPMSNFDVLPFGINKYMFRCASKREVWGTNNCPELFLSFFYENYMDTSGRWPDLKVQQLT